MSLLPFEKIKQEVIIKKEEDTNLDYGCFPEKRSVEELINYGVVNINKPEGPTSHQVADYVQRILNLKKSGHGGSLDPGVTGVLPVSLNRACRLMPYFINKKKKPEIKQASDFFGFMKNKDFDVDEESKKLRDEWERNIL